MAFVPIVVVVVVVMVMVYVTTFFVYAAHCVFCTLHVLQLNVYERFYHSDNDNSNKNPDWEILNVNKMVQYIHGYRYTLWCQWILCHCIWWLSVSVVNATEPLLLVVHFLAFVITSFFISFHFIIIINIYIYFIFTDLLFSHT